MLNSHGLNPSWTTNQDQLIRSCWPWFKTFSQFRWSHHRALTSDHWPRLVYPLHTIGRGYYRTQRIGDVNLGGIVYVLYHQATLVPSSHMPPTYLELPRSAAWEDVPICVQKLLARLAVPVFTTDTPAKLSCLHRYASGKKDLRCFLFPVSLRMTDVSPRSSPLRDISRAGTSAT